VRFLRLARWSTLLSFLIAGWLVWDRHQGEIPVLFDLPTWLPDWSARVLALSALIAGAIWATSGLLSAIWTWWVRAEQSAVLAHSQPEGHGNAFIALSAMGVIVWLAFIGAYSLTRLDSLAELGGFTGIRDGAIAAFVVALGWGWISALVVLWVWPAPDAIVDSAGAKPR
jgi:hypothetical protein